MLRGAQSVLWYKTKFTSIDKYEQKISLWPLLQKRMKYAAGFKLKVIEFANSSNNWAATVARTLSLS